MGVGSESRRAEFSIFLVAKDCEKLKGFLCTRFRSILKTKWKSRKRCDVLYRQYSFLGRVYGANVSQKAPLFCLCWIMSLYIALSEPFYIVKVFNSNGFKFCLLSAFLNQKCTRPRSNC